MKKDNIKNQDTIVIYQSKSGQPQIDIRLNKETLWLNLKQVATLFGRDKSVISRHVNDIFKSKELERKSTVAYFATVQKEGNRLIKRKIEYFNLDVIISIGYRVSSKRATQFRIWATNTLKEYLINGFVINQKQLIEQQNKFKQLQGAINFIEKKTENYLLHDKAKEIMSLLNDYAKSLNLLKQFDNSNIKVEKKSKPIYKLSYKECQEIIRKSKEELAEKGQNLFGSEYKGKLQSIIGSLNQTFDKKQLYKSIEEKGANLFYLVIKDHPFADGNKRIASILLIYYLEKNNFLYKKYERKVNNTAIVALALLVAVSDPKDKNIIIKIIISLLQ